MKTTRIPLALAPILLVATAAASGCNNTVSRVSIPANVAWNSVQLGFASPDNDLSVVAFSNQNNHLISATVGPYEGDGAWIPYGYCSTPPPDPNQQGSFLVQCPSDSASACAPLCTSMGANLNGIRYLAQIGVSITRPAFQSGGIAVQSASHGTVYTLSFSVNGTANNVLMAGGVSSGVIPTRLKTANSSSSLLAVDDYAYFDFSPHDPNFAAAEFGVPANPPYNPTVACNPTPGDPSIPGDVGDDGVLVATNAKNLGVYTCGSINLNIVLSRQYNDMQDCINDAVVAHCQNQGLVGHALQTCDAMQVQLCQTLFGHQNHDNDNDGCHNGD